MTLAGLLPPLSDNGDCEFLFPWSLTPLIVLQYREGRSAIQTRLKAGCPVIAPLTVLLGCELSKGSSRSRAGQMSAVCNNTNPNL